MSTTDPTCKDISKSSINNLQFNDCDNEQLIFKFITGKKDKFFFILVKKINDINGQKIRYEMKILKKKSFQN